MVFSPESKEEFPELDIICTILNEATPISSEVFLRAKIFPVSWRIYLFMQGLLQSQT